MSSLFRGNIALCCSFLFFFLRCDASCFVSCSVVRKNASKSLICVSACHPLPSHAFFCFIVASFRVIWFGKRFQANNNLLYVTYYYLRFIPSLPPSLLPLMWSKSQKSFKTNNQHVYVSFYEPTITCSTCLFISSVLYLPLLHHCFISCRLLRKKKKLQNQQSTRLGLFLFFFVLRILFLRDYFSELLY